MIEINGTEVATKVATNLIEDVIKNAWKKVSMFFSDLDKKESIDYGLAYEKYLTNTKNKYSKIKTIIYRRVPKDLYSFYECIGVKHNGNIIDTNCINNLLEIDNKLIITGIGGIGKSILFKHLYLNAIEKTNYIPVLIELRSFNNFEVKDISLKNAIYDNLVINGFNLEEKYFEYSMKEGGYIILLDGYDELHRNIIAKLSNEIRSLCSLYGNNKYIISSRPSAEFIGWHDFTEMEALTLSKKQAISLIEKIDFDKNVKDKFSEELKKNLYNDYKSFASNPLLLNIMLLTFDKYASIPNNLNGFYDQAFSTLYNMHDATKDSYVRDIRTGLGCEDFKLVFSYICFKSFFNNEYEFSETKLREYIQLSKDKYNKLNFTIDDFQKDLTLSVCMLVKDGLNYRFAHRSFQEYFAAWFTCKLTDDIQINLLTNWIKEDTSNFKDSYFKMLYNMQEDKVNRLILVPELKKINQKYRKLGFSKEFLEYMFEGVAINSYDKDGNDEYRLELYKIKNKYLFSFLRLTAILNNCPEYTSPLAWKKDLIADIIKLQESKKKGYISFRKILTKISHDELCNALKWFKMELEATLNILNNYTHTNISKKKTVSTILDEI